MEKIPVVVIPTFNARNSIVWLIKSIFKHLKSAKVIVVDDSSPDETGEEVKKYFSKNKRVKLILRGGKSGRGSAILAGFQEGLKDKEIEYFIEMDADLCHNPKYIPQMIKTSKKYDIVIASKYLKLSRVIGLPLRRKVFSKLVNLYIRFALGVPITDFTNGFRCYTRKTLQAIDLSSIHSRGFIVLSEIAFRIHKKKLKFGEIPITLKFKNINPSNFNFNEIKESLFTTSRLALERLNYLNYWKRKNKMTSCLKIIFFSF